MKVTDAIKNRLSTRAFTGKEVERETLTEILDTARWAASGANMQPWNVAVSTGETKRRLSDELIKAHSAGKPPTQEYDYYPKEWNDPYKTRRKACGLKLYEALEIGYDEKEKRIEAWHDNYRFFGAPVGLIFHIDKGLAAGSIMDMGIFLQSLMLAALDSGLATCPQAALADYPDIVRSVLGLPDSRLILCGMSMGYADPDAPVNNYRTDREPVESFTVWHG